MTDDRVTQYEHTLIAMERLLNAVGEEHWANWIREDIDQWRNASDTSHNLSAYGGMGSFNDVTICRANQHKVSAVQEPWVNTLFEWLKALCYFCAHRPREHATAEALARSVGRDEPSLAAFVGGDKAKPSMRGYAGSDHTLSGWRCGTCGHVEVSGRESDYFIADELVPGLVFSGCETHTLNDVVDKILSIEIEGREELRRELVHAAEASGIVMRDREEWMWECPKCGRRSSSVARWRFLPMEGRLQLSEDCLPQRGLRWWRWRLLQILIRLLTW